MFVFALASLLPAFLIALACLAGGTWALAALLCITVVTFLGDRAWPEGFAANNADGQRLSLLIGLLHPLLLALVVMAIGGSAPTLDKVLIFVAAGLWFGQVGHSNAHELIHAPSRIARRLGLLNYASLLYGHHVQAHLLVHHVHAGTRKDPNTARLGEGFWRYLIRAARGEYRAGRTAARARRTSQGPVFRTEWLIAFATLALAYLLGGPLGLLGLVGVASYAFVQLMLSDYVQHYGLERRILPDGQVERMGPHHSWNAPHALSNAMMLNAPRHSDHHMRPGRAFPALTVTPETMPILPHSLPVMAVIALVPPLWRKLMDHRAQYWSGRMDPAPGNPRDVPPALINKLRSAGQPVHNLPRYAHETDRHTGPHIGSQPRQRDPGNRATDERG